MRETDREKEGESECMREGERKSETGSKEMIIYIASVVSCLTLTMRWSVYCSGSSVTSKSIFDSFLLCSSLTTIYSEDSVVCKVLWVNVA